MASPEIGIPSCSFPLATSSPFTLVGGSQGTKGGPSPNHELSNQEVMDRHQLFYISRKLIACCLLIALVIVPILDQHFLLN